MSRQTFEGPAVPPRKRARRSRTERPHPPVGQIARDMVMRYGMTDEFARVYAALEGGVNAISYVNPYLPLPAFRRRDRARARLVEMITENIDRRRATNARPDDALQVLMESRYSDGTALTPNEITGILTAAMFAGHHTSSGTAAWTLIELLRNPEWLVKAREEVDAIYARDGGITYQSLRDVPVLESIIKEVLRLHPPLIILMRGVLHDLHVAGYTIPAGHLVAIDRKSTRLNSSHRT